MGSAIHYPEAFIERLHTRWGRGFLSPGGAEEVLEIVSGLDLAARRLLDLGCGPGGPAIVLARETGAHVLGIDIEPQLLDRARRHAAVMPRAPPLARRTAPSWSDSTSAGS